MSDLSDEELVYEPNLKHLLSKEKLNWIFVGGKGGVGKTTTACAIATLLCKQGKKVLLISTDPAHNISDALCQKISGEETKVNGIDNFYAMEIDPNRGISEKISGGNVSVFSDLVSSIPGIDEAMGFSELMKQVRHMKYDVIVFDTAPTGHTLKFLRFPSILEKGISKMIELKSKFSGLLSQISSIFSENENLKETTGILAQLEETKAVVEAVNDQFQNPELTTFVSVCIPEFLSVFETSRLIAALNDYKISCENLIVNQVLFPEENSNCSKCKARIKMQRKYLEEIDTLFDDCSIVTTPLMDEEVRGLPKIEEFSNFLVEAFQN